MPPEAQLDVLIAGGGFAGCALACALTDPLAGIPLRIGLLEAAPPPPPDGQGQQDTRGMALALSSQHILSALGIWSSLESAANPIAHIHISERGRFGSVRWHAGDHHLPAFGAVVTAAALQQALAQALAARVSPAGALAHWQPAQIRQLEPQAAAWRVHLHHAGVARVVQTKLLVIAEGTDSPTRALLGVPVWQQDYAQTAVVASVQMQRARAHTAYEVFTPQGPLALLPMRDGAKVVWVKPSAAAPPLAGLNDEEFIHALQHEFGLRAGRFSAAGARQCYPLRALQAAQVSGARFVLIGNAANTLHPNAAQGLNLALRDVAALAEKIIHAARAGSDVGAAHITESYARACAEDHRRTRQFSHGLAALFYNEQPLRRLLRGGLLWAAKQAPVQDLLVQYACGYGGVPPQLARGIPL